MFLLTNAIEDAIIEVVKLNEELEMKTVIVRIVRPSDSNFRKGQTVDLKDFLNMVEQVLKNGGEMPIATLEP